MTQKLPAIAYSREDELDDPNQAGGSPIIAIVEASPEGVVVAPLGSLAIDIVGLMLYTKADDAIDDEGWELVAGGSTGNTDLAGAVSFTDSVTPAALAAGQTDDWAPVIAAVSRVRAAADAAGSTVTGLAGGVADQFLILTNISANDLTLEPENVGSAAANRFAMNGTLILGAKQSVSMVYDGGLTRWCLIGV